ncbi:MAG: DUF362 domain-containing protein [Clostridia bacterium]|nr:DUF362 domain-containing protein [Clostridia bacterium]
MSDKQSTNFAPVAVLRQTEYNRAEILARLNEQADAIGLRADAYAGKRVVIKPNLVAPTKPDGAATTHPVFLSAVVDFLRAHGATDLLLAESPGGIYSESTLKLNYKTCGIADAAAACDLPLNFDTTANTVNAPNGQACRAFSVITPIRDADVIVDLCRLKSHSLTKMSAAVKNLFGVIPGIRKFEMHSAYPALPVFSEMIVDLCQMLNETHEMLAICDAIVGMEGNGPTGGDPKTIGAVLMSKSPFCLDLAAEAILGFEGTISITEAAKARGLCPESLDKLDIRGVSPKEITVADFREPDATRKTFLGSLSTMFGGRLADFFAPRPFITNRCVGCGVCAESCPRKVIGMIEKSGKKRASIRHSDCIRCFCCQELCPFHAIDIKQNPLVKFLH